MSIKTRCLSLVASFITQFFWICLIKSLLQYIILSTTLPPPLPSSVDYNLDQAESDELLLELLEEKDDMEVDHDNLRSRSENRHPSLFGLYPLPNREDAKENRLPVPPPAEAQGLKLHVKVSELRFVGE